MPAIKGKAPLLGRFFRMLLVIFPRIVVKDLRNGRENAVYKYVDGKAVKLCETEKLAVRINKLTPDTKYQYIVRAYVDGKWTSMKKSDIVTFKTKAE